MLESHDNNGGSQIGVEDCGPDAIELLLRRPDGFGLDGEVTYVFEDEEPVTLECTGACVVLYAKLGEYRIEGRVDEVTQTQTLTFDDSFFVKGRPECIPFREAIVLFEFES